MTTVYVSGPMTGYPGLNFEAFHVAVARLEPYVEVLDPTRHGTEGEWADFLRKDLADVMRADAVVVLPGWECSRGARLEVDVAHSLGIQVLPLDAAVQVFRTAWAERSPVAMPVGSA